MHAWGVIAASPYVHVHAVSWDIDQHLEQDAMYGNLAKRMKNGYTKSKVVNLSEVLTTINHI